MLFARGIALEGANNSVCNLASRVRDGNAYAYIRALLRGPGHPEMAPLAFSRFGEVTNEVKVSP